MRAPLRRGPASLLLASLYLLVLVLIKFLRLCLLLPLLQHKGKHAVVFLIKPRVAFYVSACPLLVDMKAFDHLSVEHPVSKKIIGREMFPALLLRLLKHCLRKMTTFPLQEI